MLGHYWSEIINSFSKSGFSKLGNGNCNSRINIQMNLGEVIYSVPFLKLLSPNYECPAVFILVEFATCACRRQMGRKLY